MPYVARFGTYLPCRTGVRVRGRSVTGGEDRDDRRGDRCGTQISLVHNDFRPTAVSAMTTGKGATYVAW
jgi:hypothetical protein